MEVLCRLSYSGLFLPLVARRGHDTESRSSLDPPPDPWDDGWMRLAPLLLVVAVACGSTPGAPAPNAPATLSIGTDDGPVSLDVQVADTPAERETGLMGRESLSPYDGMA